MELITYRKTLDVHKNGIQFMLQGFETADNMSRVIEISLMASGDAIDFPLERIVAMMYVTTPSATEPSINECTIKDNKVVYNVLPIAEEGITTMQLKLIETSPEGAKRVLASPKFSVEVTNSNVNDDGEELKTTFTAIEDFIAKADAAYGSRLERIELTSECIFKAYYYDGTTYETDILQKLFLNGNVELSKSYAMGGTGVRAGEDTDNSKYYSNVSKSESLQAKAIMKNSEEILEEVKLHGMYTAFSVDFTTGNVEYVSPSFEFNINNETGNLDAIGQSYTFKEEIGRVVLEWLEENNINFTDLQNHSEKIADHEERIIILEGVTPIEKGGTGATTKEEAIENLKIGNFIDNKFAWNLDNNVGKINSTPYSISATLNEIKEGIEFPIYMKNSGKILFRYTVQPIALFAIGASESLSRNVKLMLNNTEIANYSEEDFRKESDERFEVEHILEVNKGDIISFLFSGSDSGYPNNNGKCTEIKNINIYANVETPFTYNTLDNDNITAIDILNALTGGNE